MNTSAPSYAEAISFPLLLETIGEEKSSLIIDSMKRFDLAKGEHLLKAGHTSEYIYFVSKGVIRQYYFKGNKEVTEYFALEGMPFFSVESFIKHVATYLNIIALEPTVVIAVPREPLLTLCKTHYEIELFYRSCLEGSLIISQHRMYSMQFETAKERYNRMIHDFPSIIQKVPAIYIASYLGISPETLSRVKSSK